MDNKGNDNIAELKKFIPFLVTLNLFFQEFVKLFSLELQLAKQSLAALVKYTVILFFLIFISWLLLVIALVFLLHEVFYLPWGIALISIASIHLLGIAIIMINIKLYLHHLSFPYTRKQFSELSANKPGKANSHVNTTAEKANTAL
jgi:hypothetical protein